MSWEWLGYGTTGIVGLAGITATYLSGRGQEKAALAVVREQVEGQLTLAREERHQRRAETAYLALIEDAIALHQWSGLMVEAAMSTMGTPSETKPPPPTRQPLPNLYFDPPSSGGTLVAYWSPRVRQLVAEVRQKARTLRSGCVGFETARQDRGSLPEWEGPDAVTKVYGRQDDLISAIGALRDHISQELNALHDGTAEANNNL
jgi:hypothetical protein